MSESGQTWCREFQAYPAEARLVRRWVGSRIEHPDASQVANELFISILASGTARIHMTLSTAGHRARITAAGSVELKVHHSHGPGFHIVSGLSALNGLNTDGRGLWAQLETKTERTER
ncbi:hypothetical protein NHG22_03665 [Streptomyces sp. ATE26]|uniref:hypothetical protein n=1 Tax=Streptomyces sp. ATE26 TaxID=2954237 RepID=UPI00248319B6|nr:hypothetical protein [Streptomyces sp. ATE26]MDI1452929.1 hypothetical protein [Streptomyces sp. ATE26]